MSEEAPHVRANNLASPDPELYYELVSTKTLTEHFISQVDSPSTPLYCVTKYESFLRKKPDVVIHRGSSKSGPVLGVVRLGLGEHAIGFGDPDALLEEDNIGERVVWERLRRSNKWSYKSYEFEHETNSAGGERTKYTWQWTSRRPLGIARRLELRIGSPGEGEREILAIYKRSDWKSIKRGSFFISKKLGGDGNEESKKWELVVLLTAVGILEAINRGA